MLNWIARHYSSLIALLTAPFRAIWRFIKRFFPERDIIYISGGDIESRHQTSFWRFARATGSFIIIIWAAWSTYVFVYHRPLLQKRTRQLDEARLQHAQQMSDLNASYQMYSELNRQMNSIDDQMLNSKNMKKEDIDALLKKRVNTWAQLDMIGTRIGNMMTDADYAPEIKKLSDMSLELDMTREENRQLREANADMEESMLSVGDASVQIYDTVSKLTNDKLGGLNKSVGKIRSSLAGLGINDKELAQKALAASNPLVGSAVTPLLFDENIDQKYQDLADKIELWQGLSRAMAMLPVGAPVKNTTITSKYGSREDPINGSPAVHKGIDFAGTIGTPLFAVAPGKVIFAGEKTGYGKVVEVDHGMGFTTLYAHLSKFIVNRGDTVKAKDVVGLGGSSGRSTGPHLHYEIRYNDAPFNPYSFVKGE